MKPINERYRFWFDGQIFEYSEFVHSIRYEKGVERELIDGDANCFRYKNYLINAEKTERNVLIKVTDQNNPGREVLRVDFLKPGQNQKEEKNEPRELRGFREFMKELPGDVDAQSYLLYLINLKLNDVNSKLDDIYSNTFPG